MGETTAGGRITRFAKVLVDIAWWLGIAAGVLLVGLVLVWPTLTREGLDPTTHVEVSIADEAARRLLPAAPAGAGSPPTVEVTDLEELEGELELRVNEWWLVVVGGGVALTGLAAVLFGLHLLRMFLGDVLAGEVFTAANARRISRLGWLLVVAGVAVPILDAAYALALYRFADLSDASVGVGIDGFPAVFPGLLALVVAGAWRYGVELQRDHDLTV